MYNKDAKSKIDALLREADAKLAEAAKIAEETKTWFDWSGPAYGMGGEYHPRSLPHYVDDDTDAEYFGWQASSNSC